MSDGNNALDAHSFIDLFDLALMLGMRDDEMDDILVNAEGAPERLIEPLVLWISETILDMGYKGDDDYDNVHRFAERVYNYTKALSEMCKSKGDDGFGHLAELAFVIGITEKEMDDILVKADEDPERAVEPLARMIAYTIIGMGYEGDGDYDNMYMFGESVKNYTKALNEMIKNKPLLKPLPPKLNKEPKRYVDSDEYKRKEDDEFFKKFDRDRYRVHVDEGKSERASRFDRLIHRRDKSTLDSIREHAKDFREFWKTEDALRNKKRVEAMEIMNATPKEINEMNKITFDDWKANKGKQKQLVDDIMERLELSPYNWEINFESLNNEGRRLLFPRLKEFFEDTIAKLPIIQMYKIQFNVNGTWKSLPLKPETFNKLMENFTEENFVFDLESKAPEFFYENGGEELPTWSLFSALKFCLFENKGGNNDRGGSFFQYLTKETVPKRVVEYLKRLQIFDSLVDGKGKQRRELNDCCFVYALEQTGCYDKDTLDKIRLRIRNRYLSQSSINELCMEFGIHIKLTYIDEDASGKNKKKSVESTSEGKRKCYMGVDEAESNRTHHFNIYQKHYFIEEKTEFSTYYIKHLSECDDDKYNKEWNVDHWRKGRYFITSSNLVRELFKQNYFRPITYGQNSVLNTVFYNDLLNEEITDLTYNSKYCTRLMAPFEKKPVKGEPKKVPPTYWYADFEADTSEECHRPFMCVLHKDNGKIKKEFRGEGCDKDLLNYLPDGAVVYFHNLAYDIRMIRPTGTYEDKVKVGSKKVQKTMYNGIIKSIIKGTKTMMADVRFNGKVIHFKDTLPVLSCKLSELPKMFDIKGIKKELFPYNYYTLDRLNRGGVGVISEAGLFEVEPWTDEQKNAFKENIDGIDGCRIDDDKFDMWKYCSFYCQQDVNILREGFNKFRNGFIEDFDIDPFKFISISSLANEVFKQRVYYPNRNLFELGGVVRKFCSRAIYGGRCMTAYNKKWHTTVPLCDFDAVSLYPSAMARLYTVEGRPIVITEDKLNYEFLSKQSAYVVDIEITKVNKHYPFPLIVRKVDGLNLNDDNLKDGEVVKMTVDNIMLEDLIKFQEIEFKLVRGYYWNGKKDYTIQKEIRNIFSKRLEYKKSGNPLQQLYKLIMNSCYGKTIERPIEKDFKYFHEGEELDRYWKKNYYKIVEDNSLKGTDNHAVKTLKPIDKHFNFSLLGIQVLSMSKRIMNEVMCLAFDIGCCIYYQDTDSFMIKRSDLEILEKGFKEKYNRDLIGTNLGNFHCDFPSINGHDEMPFSVEAYFLMKKMYVHKITDSSNEIDYVIRGKGLTQKSIQYAFRDKQFNGNVMELYKHLYEGNEYTFDLTKGQPCFSMNKDMTVSTLKKFERKIKVTYEEGDVEWYGKQQKANGDDYDNAKSLCLKSNIDGLLGIDESEIDPLLADRELMSGLIESLRESVKDSPLRKRFENHFMMTFNNLKYGSVKGGSVCDKFLSKQTGMRLNVNECFGLGVIDFDINKGLSDDERKKIRERIMSKLSLEDIVVRSGSGGLHVYVNNDFDELYKNAYIKCYACDEYEIDYIAAVKEDKQAGVMLPGSFNANGKYEFVRGSFESVIKRSAKDVLKDLELTLKLDAKQRGAVDDSFNGPIEYLSDDDEMKLVNGLTGMEVHNFASKIDERLSLMPLFCAINCLSPTNREKAYDMVLSKCNLSDKAMMNFDEVKDNCLGKHTHINVLRKIIRLYNNRYYVKESI